MSVYVCLCVCVCLCIIHKYIKRNRKMDSGECRQELWPIVTDPLLLVQNLLAIDEGVVSCLFPSLISSPCVLE